MVSRETEAGLGSLHVSEGARTQLRAYLYYLVTLGRSLGLVGPEQTGVAEQIARSILLGRTVGSPRILIDVGSGSGLPGIPLAIYLQDMASKAAGMLPDRIILIEPKRKAVAFLEKVVRDLKLRQVEIMPCRAQQARDELQDKGDVVVAKAVASARPSFALCAPLCRPGGKIYVTAPANFRGELPHLEHLDLIGPGLKTVISEEGLQQRLFEATRRRSGKQSSRQPASPHE